MKMQKIDLSGLADHLAQRRHEQFQEQLLSSIPTELIPMFNAFVDSANKANLLFQELDIKLGITNSGEQGMEFIIETYRGLTDLEAIDIFQNFINAYPTAQISYNKRPEATELEKVLYGISETVLEVDEGFKLKRI